MTGRELSISDNSERVIRKNLIINDFSHIKAGFDLGEVSFNSGWIFHRDGANKTDQQRKVITIIYMDKDMTLKSSENEGQQKNWETLCPGVEIESLVNSTINPILFEH